LKLEYLKNEEITELKKYVESTFKMLSKMIANIELKTPLATTP
jgi:hypothetical protein